MKKLIWKPMKIKLSELKLPKLGLTVIPRKKRKNNLSVVLPKEQKGNSTLIGNKNKNLSLDFKENKSSVEKERINLTTSISETKYTLTNDKLALPNIMKGNLYKNIIVKDFEEKQQSILNNHEENESLLSSKDDSNYSIASNRKSSIRQSKIDLAKITKNIIPRIDDISDFLIMIQKKHKNLFSNLKDLLERHRLVKRRKKLKIPKKLYQDKKYFLERFGPHKKSNVKFQKFPDVNMLYPSLIDYNEFLIIIKEYLDWLQNENFILNALDFKQGFYEKILYKILNDDSLYTTETTSKSITEKLKNFLCDTTKKMFGNNANSNNLNISNSIINTPKSILRRPDKGVGTLKTKKINFIQGFIKKEKSLKNKNVKRPSSFSLNSQNDQNNIDDSLSMSSFSLSSNENSCSYLDNSDVFERTSIIKRRGAYAEIPNEVIIDEKKKSKYDIHFRNRFRKLIHDKNKYKYLN